MIARFFKVLVFLFKGFVMLVAGFVTLALLYAGYIFMSYKMETRADRLFYEQVMGKGKVNVTEMETGWNRVCVIGPYCEGWPKNLPLDGCELSWDEVHWALVFLHDGEVISQKVFMGVIEYEWLGVSSGKGVKENCFDIKNNPTFFTVGPKKLVLRATK